MHIAQIIVVVVVALLPVAGLIALRLAIHSSRAPRSDGFRGRRAAGATAPEGTEGSVRRGRRRLG